jgi:hypothetical protein
MPLPVVAVAAPPRFRPPTPTPTPTSVPASTAPRSSGDGDPGPGPGWSAPSSVARDGHAADQARRGTDGEEDRGTARHRAAGRRGPPDAAVADPGPGRPAEGGRPGDPGRATAGQAAAARREPDLGEGAATRDVASRRPGALPRVAQSSVRRPPSAPSRPAVPTDDGPGGRDDRDARGGDGAAGGPPAPEVAERAATSLPPPSTASPAATGGGPAPWTLVGAATSATRPPRRPAILPRPHGRHRPGGSGGPGAGTSTHLEGRRSARRHDRDRGRCARRARAPCRTRSLG